MGKTIKYTTPYIFRISILLMLALFLISPNLSHAVEIVYEDAEDGTTDGWEIYDDDPAGAVVSNVYDDDKESRVIEFNGHGTSNGYRLRNADGSKWQNTNQFVIEWSMNYSQGFTIYIDIETTAGNRYMMYTPVSEDELGDGTYIRYGLGTSAKDANWHTFIRDLQADLEQAQPGVTIEEVNGFLIRGSGLVDDIKLFDEFDTTFDTDGDGITDYDEMNTYGTNPYIKDSDNDGIDDNEELDFWSDDWDEDYDSDGLINLLDADSDNDGYTDGVEIAQGFDPSDAGSVPPYVLYEDAEDGTTDGWEIYDDDPAGAAISNVYDGNRQSRVIEFNGHGTSNGYRLRNADGSKWQNTNQFVIEWSMNYSESFTIYIDIETTAGNRYMVYTPVNEDELGDGTYVRFGLGTSSKDGQWHTFMRDLQADLEQAQPGVTIEEVNGFLVRGSGRVDDINLLDEFDTTLDTDGDGITDYYEINTYGTNPYIKDSDNDGIDDNDELNFWGDDWNEDYDSDGLINLLDADSDNDGYNDGVEIAQGFDPSDPGSVPPYVLYEDAEDGTTDSWEIYDDDPAGAVISNVYDDSRQSRAIEFYGLGTSNGYRLRNANGSKWQNTNQFVIEWSMNYSQGFTIYMDIETTSGHRYMMYTPVNEDELGDGTYVRFGLGASAKDGNWHTFIRDLQSDLELAQPGVTIEEVNGFLIRGSGRVDDIKLLDSMEPLNKDIDYGLDFNEQQGGGGLVGETIRILNGNMIQLRSDLSFASPHRMGLSFRAAYNSVSYLTGSLGFGWTHTYSALLDSDFEKQGTTYIKIIDQTGRAAYFLEETLGVYKGAFNECSSVKIESGEYVWYKLDGSKYGFSASGLLYWIDDEKGNRLTLVHDAQDRLQTVTDAASGRVLTFNYNADNRLTSMSGPITPEVPSGVHVTYGYDTNQNLTSVTYADGSGLTYSYTDITDIHNLTEKKDKDNHVINTWAYDDQDRCIENFSVQGRGVSINYNDGSQVDVTDAYGTSRSYILQEISGRMRVADMQGTANAPYSSNNNIRWGYDSQMRLVEVESKGGTINQFQDYDERGNPGTVILAAGTTIERVITVSYHPNIDVLLSRTEASVLGAGNKVTTWDFDDDYDNTPNEDPTGLISRIIEQGYTRNSGGSIITYEYITTFTYNNKGQVLTIDGPLAGTEDTTTFGYDISTGDLFSVTRPLIGVTTFSNYDAAGKAGRITNVNGQSKNFTYDGRGRIAAVTNEADGSLSTITYNLSGFPDSTTDEDSVSRSFDYDTIYGRLANINDAQGNYIAYDYDTQGNRIEMSNHESSGTRTSRERWNFQYPVIPGLLFREIKADDSYQQYGYDNEGNVTSVADYESHTTTYNYDPLNRPISVTQPGDITTGYGYDTQSNLTSVTDAKNQVTSFIYDDMGRLVSTTSPDTGTKTHVFDEAGNTIRKTDANGINVGYTYDDLNRLINVNFPDSTQNITYTYDTGTNGIGRRTGMVDPSGTVSFSYDSRGRFTGKTSIINGFTYNITNTFTPGNRVSSFTYPSGRGIDYTRNALGRWDTVTTTYNSSTITLAGNLSYRPFGIPNGMNTGSGGAVSNASSECDCLSISNPGQPMEQTFTYDHNSNLKTIRGTNTPSFNQDFSYDALNRLTDATGAYGSINYTYDNVGNRITRTIGSQTETYTYITGTNKLYQITGTGDPVTYTYDANGNVTGFNNKTLIYSQNNRLIRVEENSDILGEYKYNGLGQRVIKEADGIITVFHYNIYGKLIAESLADGTITAEYLYMGKIRMAKVDVATGAIYYYLNDRLGTPQILTDDTGKVVWEAEYKPFGEADVNPNSEVVNNIRLPGQYFDTESGLHYNWHRYYDPSTGRYFTPDPIGLAGGINPFLYSFNNPANLIDPLGLRPLTGGERNALRYYFGPSANLDAIDLEGTTGRGNAVFPNNINLPLTYFRNNNECEEVDLDNPEAFSILAHEVLHHWQRQHGRSVTLAAAIPQLGYSLGIHDPYDYDRSITNSNLLLNEFTSGSVEQQAQMFQDFVFQEQTNRLARERGYPNRYNTSRFEGVSQHVYWH